MKAWAAAEMALNTAMDDTFGELFEVYRPQPGSDFEVAPESWTGLGIGVLSMGDAMTNRRDASRPFDNEFSAQAAGGPIQISFRREINSNGWPLIQDIKAGNLLRPVDRPNETYRVAYPERDGLGRITCNVTATF